MGDMPPAGRVAGGPASGTSSGRGIVRLRCARDGGGGAARVAAELATATVRASSESSRRPRFSSLGGSDSDAGGSGRDGRLGMPTQNADSGAGFRRPVNLEALEPLVRALAPVGWPGREARILPTRSRGASHGYFAESRKFHAVLVTGHYPYIKRLETRVQCSFFLSLDQI